MKPVETDDIIVRYDGKKCIHARRCVLGLPAVFVPNAEGAWIKPENADAEELARLIDTCPSGALSYSRKDGGQEEATPQVNTARLWENGPVEYRGQLKMPDDAAPTRALMCRCGKSKNKPYCDNSHFAADFQVTGDVASTDKFETLDARGGDLTIKPVKDGPLMVSGPLEIIAGSGRRIQTGEKHFMCRCGASKNQPFCDGSHKDIGFEAD